MSTFTIFLVLIMIVAFLLVVVIMVQNPKGGGLSSSFGGGGGGGQIGGVQKTSDFLDKSTWTLATIMLVLIMFSNVFVMGGNTMRSKTFDENAIQNTIPAVPTTDTPTQTETENPE
ncbi:MAG: preprotein translocase subunit SecG [Aequorivita sp.]